MSELLATFLLRRPDVVATGPYFRGYCGEHVSEYPLIQQKSGSETIVRKMIRSKALLGGMSILFILLIIYVNSLKQGLHRLPDRPSGCYTCLLNLRCQGVLMSVPTTPLHMRDRPQLLILLVTRIISFGALRVGRG
jgi:hypothetical protein